MKYFLHPSAAALDAFAEFHSATPKSRRIANHLERCHLCRNEVAFRRDLSAAAAALKSPEPPGGLLERVIRDRENGDRLILPVHRSAVSRGGVRLYRYGASAALIAAAAVIVFYVFRTTEIRPVSSAWFLPAAAVAAEASAERNDPQPLGPQIDGTRMRERVARYQRQYIDKNGVRRRAGEGVFQLRRMTLDGNPVWSFRRDWTEYPHPGAADTTHENELLLLNLRNLRLIRRDVDAFPYMRYSRITIAQRFGGDRVYGRMMSEGGDSRGVGRRFSRRLPPAWGPYITDAFAPVFFTSIRLTPDWRGRLSILGWAVRDSDVFYPIDFQNVGRERVSVPAGVFNCWHMIIKTGGRRFDYWARTSDGLGVRSRNETLRTTLGVTEVVLISESN